MDQEHSMPKRKKRTLSDAEKEQIYQFHQTNPLVTHSNIAGIFGVDRSTVSKVLQNRYLTQTTLSSPGTRTQIPDHNSNQHENALAEWARETKKAGIHVTRDMLRRQAAILATAQWNLKPFGDAESVFESCHDAVDGTGMMLPSIEPHSHRLTSPDISLDWIDSRSLDRVINTCSSSSAASSSEPLVPDLFSVCTAGLTGIQAGIQTQSQSQSQTQSQNQNRSQDHSQSQSQSEDGGIDTPATSHADTPHQLCNLPDLPTPSLSLDSTVCRSDSPWGVGTSATEIGRLTGVPPPPASQWVDRRRRGVQPQPRTGSDEVTASSLAQWGLDSSETTSDDPCGPDKVCLHEARHALSALEHYLAGLPGPTALDQLCLNHVRGRLGR